MATKSIVGALRASLSLESAAFVRGANRAETRMQKLGQSMRRIGGAIVKALKLMAVAATAAFTAMAAGLKSVLSDADKIAKTSQKLGIASDELVKLRHAAELSGVEFSALQNSVLRLTQAMSDVVKGGTTDAVRAFKALGIEVRNSQGGLKTHSEILGEIADKFAQYRDGAEKTALAMAIFGRRGTEMIPMLNQGKAAMEAAKKEAEDFGLVMSTRLQKASEQLNDNMSRLWKVFQGIWVTLAERVVPWMAATSEAIVQWAKESKVAQTIGVLLADTFKWIAKAAIVLYGTLAFVAEGLRVIGNIARNIYAGQWEKIPEDIKKSGHKIRDTIRQVQSQLGSIDIPLTIGGGKPGQAAKPSAPTLGKAAAGGAKKAAKAGKKDPFETILNNARLYIEKQKALKEAISLTKTAAAELTFHQDLLNKATQANIKLTPVQSQKLAEVAKKMAEAKVAAEEYKEVFDFIKGSLKGFFSSLRSGLEQGKSFWQAFADSAKGVLDKVIDRIENQFIDALMKSKFMTDLLSGSFGSLGGAVQGAGGMIRNLSGALSGLGGFLSNILGSLFRGGFASGGSFRVGGNGGVDSQTVMFKASPNETVHVTKPNQTIGGGAGNSIVNVYAPEGTTVERRQRRGSNGQNIEDIILKSVNKAIGRGRTDNAMFSRFDMRPSTLKR